MAQLSHTYVTTGKTTALSIQQSDVSAFSVSHSFPFKERLVIARLQSLFFFLKLLCFIHVSYNCNTTLIN